MMHIFWDYTRECNLKCSHCYNAVERLKSPPDLEKKSRFNLINQISQKYSNSTLHFLGGEPLISSDFVEVAIYAKRLGFKLQVTTNGTVNNKKIIQFLVNNFSIVHLSLDGADAFINDKVRGKGVFVEVVKFIQNWNNCSEREKRSSILNLSFTVTKPSLNNARDIINFCLKNHIDRLTIQPVKIIGNATYNSQTLGITAEEYFKFGEEVAKTSVGEPLEIKLTGGSMRYKDYIKWNFYNDIVDVEPSCNSGSGQLRITSTGKILPCFMGGKAPIFIQKQWQLSNNKNELNNILSANSFQSFTKEAHKKSVSQTPDICSNCEYLVNHQCFPGCPLQGNYTSALLCKVLSEK